MIEPPILNLPVKNSHSISKATIAETYFDQSDYQGKEFSATFLTNLLNSIADPIFVKDSQHKWILCNDAFCNLMGRSQSELLGKSDNDFMPAAEADVFWEKDEQVLSTGSADVNEEFLIDAEGITHAITTHCSRFEDETGNQFLVGTVRSFGSCHHVEAQLHQSQRVLQQILDSLPQSIFWKDRHSVYLGCNRNFARDAGLNSSDEIVGKTDYDLPWTREESEFYRECDRRVMNTNQPRLHIIETQKQANGKHVWVDTSKVPLHNADGTVIGILGTYKDITERKQTEIALQQLNEDLEHRVQQRTAALRHLVRQLRQEIRDRQKAEAEQQKFVALVENSSDFIGIATLDGQVLSINEAGQKLFGSRDLEAATAISMMEYVFPDDREEFAQHVLPVVMQQGSWQGVCRFQHIETGEVIPIEENVFVVKDSATGKPVCLAAIGRDIRERQQAEARLQEQEQFLRTVYNGVEHLIFTIDVSESGEFCYVGWNEPTTRATGISNADAIGKTPREVFGEVDGADMERNYRRCLQSEAAISYEENIVFQGEETWWMTTITPLRSQSDSFGGSPPGKIDRLIGTTFNITDRKRAEALLTEQVRLTAFRADVDIALTRGDSLPTMLTNCTTAVVTHLDALFARIWTLDTEQKILELQASSGLYTHIDGGHARIPVGQFKIGQIAAEGRPYLTNNVLEDPRIGDREWAKQQGIVAFAGFPLIVEGQLLGVLALFACHQLPQLTLDYLEFASDEISLGIKRKQTEAQLKRKTQDLEKALRELQRTQIQLIQSEKMSSLGQLVAGIAHEINNPVSFIYGNLTYIDEYTLNLLKLIDLYQENHPNFLPEIQETIELIDLNFLKEDLPKIIDSMKVGADRIKNIILSLRNFSRMDESALKSVNLQEGIESTLMILQNRLKAQGNRPTIEVISESENLPPIECYAGQLNQVFMNILTNAIDAIEESLFLKARLRDRHPGQKIEDKGQILIRTAVLDNNWVSVRIRDNGVGMTEAVRQRIFDPFFTTKPIGKGTGMGLSICYQIITNRHGGTLECISAPGSGTEFVIQIPPQQ
jgi:two-component system, NtrC family, sensor kinase